MENLTRRKFFQGAGVLAAAAVAGIPLSGSIRKHGPMDIRLYFFSKDPFVIKGDLLADHDNDLFRVHAYYEKKVDVIAEMKLSEIQKIVSMPRKKIRLEMIFKANGNTVKEQMCGVSRDGTLSFLPGEEGSPIWLMLEDVKQVL